MSYCQSEPLGTSGVFNEGVIGGPYNHNFQEVPDYFCVFREWTGGVQLRFKFEISESAGTIYIYGKLDGADVWNANGAVMEKREAVAFSGTTTVTSTNLFDAKGLKVTKPATNGRVSMYAVDTDGEETLVAVYEPSETVPRWRRYRVPCLCDGESSCDYIYAAIVRQGYLPLVNSYDEVIPGNIAAIRLGLSALLKEDAEDYARAEQLWELAKLRLVAQSESESEGTEDHVEVPDDFNMQSIGTGL